MPDEPLHASSVHETHVEWIERGHMFKSKGLLAEAIEAYLRAININGAHADSWRFLGNAYYKMGQFTQACKAYKISSQLNPDESKIWLNLANTYAHLEMTVESESCKRLGHSMIESILSIRREKK